MDDMIRTAYLTLLESGADYEKLTEKQEVERLEGFHDYIVVREETGVDHPGLEEYIEVKKRLGDELISFSTARHRSPIEGEGPAPELADEDVTEVPETPDVEDTEEPVTLVTGAPGYGSNFSYHQAIIDKAVEEKVSGRRRAEEVPETTAVYEAPKEEAPAAENPVTRAIFADDEEEVVISSETDEDAVEDSQDTPDFEELLSADKSERKEEKKFIVQATVETDEDIESTPRITPSDVIDKDFTIKSGGYDQDSVDDFLDDVAKFMSSAHDVSDWLDKAEAFEHQEFDKVRGFMKKGYVISEVKEFTDALKVEFEIRASEA
ncbi:MAG: DivIVA domain-containing protein [Enterococcus sp.]|nr:DivIVA domain-containing protein [Enterococcus sp.]